MSSFTGKKTSFSGFSISLSFILFLLYSIFTSHCLLSQENTLHRSNFFVALNNHHPKAWQTFSATKINCKRTILNLLSYSEVNFCQGSRMYGRMYGKCRQGV